MNKTEGRKWYPTVRDHPEPETQRGFIVEAVGTFPGITTEHLRELWIKEFTEDDPGTFTSRLTEMESKGFIMAKREADLF